MQSMSPPVSRAADAAAGASILSVLALVVFAAITPMILLIAPAIAGQLGAQLQLTPSQIGNYFFVELGSFSLASLPSLWWMRRVSTRRVATMAVAVFVIGNLVTAWLAPSYVPLLWLRAVTGLAGGTLMVLCMTSAAQSTNQDRIYGFWVIGQLVVGAAGLFLLPKLFVDTGIGAFYYLLAGLAVLAAPLAFHFPPAAEEAAPDTNDATASGIADTWFWTAALALLAVLGFYMAIGAVWTFAGSAAETAGLDAASTGTVLAVASLFGIAGAALAAYVGGRIQRIRMLTLGYLLLIGSVVALCTAPRAAGYAVAISVFKFGWTFVLPFILAAVANVDRGNKLVAALTLVIGAGLAFGPMVGGQMIEIFSGLQAMFLSAVAITLLSMAGLLWLCRRASR